MNIEGASVNLNGKPWHLQIYLSGGSGNSISVNNSVVGALTSGPNASFDITNSHWFGAAIADMVRVRDSAIHYDSAVKAFYLGSTAWTTDSFINPATTKKLTITPPSGGAPPDPCLLYTSPSPRDGLLSRMPSSA